jgi:hypothetical protein
MNKWGGKPSSATNNADEGVGSGPGGPPYIKLRNRCGADAFVRAGPLVRLLPPHVKLVHERPMQITVHCLQ